MQIALLAACKQRGIPIVCVAGAGERSWFYDCNWQLASICILMHVHVCLHRLQ